MLESPVFLPSQENLVIFRRVELKVLDDSYFESVTFDWRPVAHNVIRLNATAHNLLKTVNFMEIHVVAYHRYATWQKFLIDLWENACDALDPNIYTPVLDIAFKFVRPYTNFRHPCPYRVNETVYFAADKMNFSKLLMPLLPSGPYRLDVTVAVGRTRHPILFLQIYTEISDHRVWH